MRNHNIVVAKLV